MDVMTHLLSRSDASRDTANESRSKRSTACLYSATLTGDSVLLRCVIRVQQVSPWKTTCFLSGVANRSDND